MFIRIQKLAFWPEGRRLLLAVESQTLGVKAKTAVYAMNVWSVTALGIGSMVGAGLVMAAIGEPIRRFRLKHTKIRPVMGKT
jgi:hypothetical protein